MAVSRQTVALVPMILVLGGVACAWADPVAAHVLDAAIALCFLVWLLFGTFAGTPMSFHWLVLAPLGCAAIGAVQIWQGWTVSPFETWSGSASWFARAAIFTLASQRLTSSRAREAAPSTFALIASAFAFVTILAWYSSPGKVFWLIHTEYDSGIAGTFLNRDQYAAFIELVLPIALFNALRPGRPLVWAACAATLAASVVATGSRAGSAMIGLECVGFLGAALLSNRGRRKPALILALVLAAAVLSSDTHELVARLNSPDPFRYRREMLQSTAAMIHARPLTGFGVGTWPLVYPAYAVFDPPGLFMNHAHNDWAEWTAEGGVPSLLLLLAMAGGSLALLRKAPWSAGILGILLHATVDFPLHKEALAITTFGILGWAVGSTRELSKLPKRLYPPPTLVGSRQPN